MSYPNTPLSTLLPYVLPHVPGCPDPVAEFELRMAAIEFCERTRCWRHMVQVEIASNNRTIIAPSFSQIHEFEEATHNGLKLTPSLWTEGDPDELSGQVREGLPQFITQFAPGQVSIRPFRAGTLRVSAFLKPCHGNAFGYDIEDPLRDAYNTIPAFMRDQYADALAKGALARLHGLPEERFTDPNRSAEARAYFNLACDSAFAANLKGQQRAPIRTKTNWM